MQQNVRRSRFLFSYRFTFHKIARKYLCIWYKSTRSFSGYHFILTTRMKHDIIEVQTFLSLSKLLEVKNGIPIYRQNLTLSENQPLPLRTRISARQRTHLGKSDRARLCLLALPVCPDKRGLLHGLRHDSDCRREYPLVQAGVGFPCCLLFYRPL